MLSYVLMSRRPIIEASAIPQNETAQVKKNSGTCRKDAISYGLVIWDTLNPVQRRLCTQRV